MPDYDAIIIGAGHNALVTGAYLVQAGYHVCVFEQRDIPGGVVSSREIVPGFQFDLGFSAHIMIRLTPVIDELQLLDHGLEYRELDPLLFSPVDDERAIYIWRDVDRTISNLNALFPGEGDAYGRFVKDWRPFARAVKETFLVTPGPFDLGRKLMKSRALGGDWRRALPFILKPYGEIVDHYFTNERLKTMLVWMAAQYGPPPTEPMSGRFLLWHPLYHESGIAFPRGGSGELARSLVRHIRSYGGDVRFDTRVDEIIVKGGRVTGIRTGSETCTARAVVSGTHAPETFFRLLPETHRPGLAQHMRTGNGSSAVLRLALSSPVTYRTRDPSSARTALQLLCRDRLQIQGAYGDYLKRTPAQDPPLLAMTFSAVDDSIAPPGGEVLSIWTQYVPYDLTQSSWDEISADVAERLLDAFEGYAPDTKDKVVGSLFQHPLWLERNLGVPRGNLSHLEMSIDQMFMMRPFVGAAQYRTHLKGLYLTGASTHPGGGIMGASGRNTAQSLLKDLDRKRV